MTPKGPRTSRNWRNPRRTVCRPGPAPPGCPLWRPQATPAPRNVPEWAEPGHLHKGGAQTSWGGGLAPTHVCAGAGTAAGDTVRRQPQALCALPSPRPPARPTATAQSPPGVHARPGPPPSVATLWLRPEAETGHVQLVSSEHTQAPGGHSGPFRGAKCEKDVLLPTRRAVSVTLRRACQAKTAGGPCGWGSRPEARGAPPSSPCCPHEGQAKDTQ